MYKELRALALILSITVIVTTVRILMQTTFETDIYETNPTMPIIYSNLGDGSIF
jgi:low affinity Fe/Cu permease